QYILAGKCLDHHQRDGVGASYSLCPIRSRRGSCIIRDGLSLSVRSGRSEGDGRFAHRRRRQEEAVSIERREGFFVMKSILNRYGTMLAVGVASVCLALSLFAQGGDTYKTRLSALPADAKTRPDLAGTGTVTATLAGKKLTVNGTFEGLKTN